MNSKELSLELNNLTNYIETIIALNLVIWFAISIH